MLIAIVVLSENKNQQWKFHKGMNKLIFTSCAFFVYTEIGYTWKCSLLSETRKHWNGIPCYDNISLYFKTF